MTDREALIALTHFVKFGPAGLRKLQARLGSWLAVWQATSTKLESAGLAPSTTKEFGTWRTSFNLERASLLMAREKISTVCLGEALYPEPLTQITQPPLVLYYQGELNQKLWTRALAVVGSRKYTQYGQRVIEDLIKPVAQAGLTIVSGLALGIDALAHQATLAVRGQTVAVLGSGIDQASLYPSANRGLARAIIDHGGVIMSEFAPGTAGFRFNFPRRNRIIAGLAAGTLVIEAGIKSGSLITANYALDANREVLAVPNSIYAEGSSGTNYLLQLGAKLITCSEDILQALDWQSDKAKSRQQLNSVTVESLALEPEERAILVALSGQEKSVNDLTKELKLDISKINARLSLMEINGLVRSVGPTSFTAVKNL